MSELSGSARRVQDELTRLGHDKPVVELSQSTRTAAAAAAAIGCTVGQIAKSLVFRTARTDSSLLVVASGVNRVDERAVAQIVSTRIEPEEVLRADADFVRERTGFAIGGVPPVGHDDPPLVLIDTDLFQFPIIWAAAGTPRAVFELTPWQLVNLTGGTMADIAKHTS